MANRPAKNISSLPSHTMVPTDTMFGRVAGPEPRGTERDGAADAVATSSLWGQGPTARSNTPAGETGGGLRPRAAVCAGHRAWWPFATIGAMTDSPGGHGSTPTLSTDPASA